MDEEADLALLDQHLLKTNALSQRMTSILAQLDSRLSRLDKSIAPLGLQTLTRKANNIDAAILAMSPEAKQPAPAKPVAPARPAPHTRNVSTASSRTSAVKGYSLEPTLTPVASAPGTGTATPAEESALLIRGPDIMALGEYFTAMEGVIGDLERMWKGFTDGRGGAREAGVKDLSKLVEVGFGGLVELFLRISNDSPTRHFDPEQLLETGPPAPPNFFAPYNTLVPLTTRVDKILAPAGPHPKTESIVMPIFEDGMGSFANLRGEWMKRSLNTMVAKIEEVDEGGIWESSRGMEKARSLADLWEALIVVVEAETLLITTLFPERPPSALLPATIAHPLSLVVATMQPTLNTIKRSLSSHTFVALDLYQSLARTQGKWDTILNKCFSMANVNTSSADASTLQSALVSSLTTLRGLVLRSFPELLVDIRTSQSQTGSTSSISDTTHSTLTYLETLPLYEKTVENLLARSQSERSWLMGQKDTPSPAKNANEEGGVVNLYVADVLGTLLIYLDGRARSMRRPVGQAFLLNNLSHIRNTTSSFHSDIIGPGAEDMLNKAFRDAKTQYLAEWSHLVGLLNTVHTPRFGANPLGHSERSSFKEGLTAFFDRLAELERICAENPLNRQDPDMRDRVAKEVEDVVLAGYRPFYGKCTGKGLEKYLRDTPDGVARRIQAIFR